MISSRVMTVLVLGALLCPIAPVQAAIGDITSVAGTTVGYSGDGGPARDAQLHDPRSLSPTSDDGYLIADVDNNVIRKVAANGTITTVAGTGVAGYTGDGGPATAATLNFPTYVASLPGGGFLIADEFNDVIRKVDAGGTITTVAGTGVPGFSGDGGPATSAQLRQPRGVAPIPGGGFLIADEFNDRVRRVSPAGTITTVAGPSNGISHPISVLPLSGGAFLVADRDNNRVLRVSSSGSDTTIAGDGTAGLSGDGGPATSARLNKPRDLALGPDGSLYIVDSDNSRVRRVLNSGIILTVAGTSAGLSGDGGPATSARLRIPRGLTFDTDGDLLIADTDNHRVRRVDIENDTSAPSVTLRQPASGAVGVGTNTKVAATFSEAIDPSSVTTGSFSVAPASGGAAVPAALAPNASFTSFTLTPTSLLEPGKAYRATLSTQVQDLSGNNLSGPVTWTFTTAPLPDLTPPTLTARAPSPDAVGIAAESNIDVTFSEQVDPATLSASSFLLAPPDGMPVPATVTLGAGGASASLNPSESLQAGIVYRATVARVITDLAGNAMAADDAWTFTTAAGPAAPPPPPVVTKAPPRGPLKIAAGWRRGTLVLRVALARKGARRVAVWADITRPGRAERISATTIGGTKKVVRARLVLPTPRFARTAVVRINVRLSSGKKRAAIEYRVRVRRGDPTVVTVLRRSARGARGLL